MRHAYQRPPASSIAFSRARFDAVRRLPELRGASGLPAASRRRARSAAKSSNFTGSGFEAGDSMLTNCLLADAPLKISTIGILMKGE